MRMQVPALGAGSLLATSGALMYAASWQRWADACGWGDGDSVRCSHRQDHRYDFVAPAAPWEPVGQAAQLAGWSLLVLAAAFLLLPWAMTGRRPGVLSALVLLGAVLALGLVGLATLRSGLAGRVVEAAPGGLALGGWLLLPPALLVRLAVAARGWALAAAGWLVLAMPLVAVFTYAIGPYDARPWWEGISGLCTVVAGVCLGGAAVLGTPHSRGLARRSRTSSRSRRA